MYTLHTELELDTTPAKAWDFIRNPANLNRITPDDMEFEIVSDLPEEMHEGMLVEYRVKIPIIGKQVWLSEIKHIRPMHSFVDEQKIGPYRFWYHYHGIEPCGSKVKFIDQVVYEVPFAIIGRLAHRVFIRRTLERIFQHRERMLHKLLEE